MNWDPPVRDFRKPVASGESVHWMHKTHNVCTPKYADKSRAGTELDAKHGFRRKVRDACAYGSRRRRAGSGGRLKKTCSVGPRGGLEGSWNRASPCSGGGLVWRKSESGKRSAESRMVGNCSAQKSDRTGEPVLSWGNQNGIPCGTERSRRRGSTCGRRPVAWRLRSGPAGVAARRGSVLASRRPARPT